MSFQVGMLVFWFDVVGIESRKVLFSTAQTTLCFPLANNGNLLIRESFRICSVHSSPY